MKPEFREVFRIQTESIKPVLSILRRNVRAAAQIVHSPCLTCDGQAPYCNEAVCKGERNDRPE